MRHRGLFITLIVFVLLCGSFFAGMLVYLAFGSGPTTGGFFTGDALGVVTIEGPIITSRQAIDDIEEFRKSRYIKGVVLRVDSPGGSAAASQEIFEAVRRLAEKKPVVASMGTVAASGGYYVSCGANRIYANPGTTTGSIGVRLEHMIFGDLMEWAKIRRETLKSGSMKDMMPFDRPISEEAKKVLQGVVEDIHRQFKEAVAKSRGIDPAKVEEIADGRVYTGEQALLLGLVDKIGGITVAVEDAAKMAGIDGEPELVYPKQYERWIERILVGVHAALARASFEGPRPMMMMNFNTSPQ